MLWLLSILVSSALAETSVDTVTADFYKVYDKYVPANQRTIKKEIRVQIAALEGEKAGICRQYKNSPPLVILDKSRWERFNYIQKEMIAFHELAHCLLGRNHRNGYTNKGDKLIPVSLMSAESSYDAYTYLRYRDYYLEELFLHHD
jgi:hypothetical protein